MRKTQNTLFICLLIAGFLLYIAGIAAKLMMSPGYAVPLMVGLAKMVVGGSLLAWFNRHEFLGFFH